MLNIKEFYKNIDSLYIPGNNKYLHFSSEIQNPALIIKTVYSSLLPCQYQLLPWYFDNGNFKWKPSCSIFMDYKMSNVISVWIQTMPAQKRTNKIRMMMSVHPRFLIGFVRSALSSAESYKKLKHGIDNSRAAQTHWCNTLMVIKCSALV